jgi:predicted nucleic acid-binding protein
MSIVPQSSLQFQDALVLYAARNDKEWSHTDCASFQAMKREGIAEALTHDRHFEQVGFRALLRD